MEHEIVTAVTDDGLSLPGEVYRHETPSKDCVLLIQGDSASVYVTPFITRTAKALASQGTSAVVATDRGRELMSVISSADGTKRVMGTAFALFEEFYLDVLAWVHWARQQSYDKVILVGHSIGCAKILSAFDKHALDPPPDVPGMRELIDVAGVGFVAPVDPVGFHDRGDPHGTLWGKAYDLYRAGHDSELVYNRGAEPNPERNGGTRVMSAAAYVQANANYGPADLISLRRPDDDIPAMGNLRAPLLVVMGGRDKLVTHSAEHDARRILSSAVHAPRRQGFVVSDGSHNFLKPRASSALVSVLSDWVRGITDGSLSLQPTASAPEIVITPVGQQDAARAVQAL